MDLRALGRWLLVLLFTGPLAAPLSAQSAADPQLAAEIARIRAIDNHAHPFRFVAEGEAPDDEFDALPPVHIHVSDGAGSYYRQSGSNPLLLESVFNDPTLRGTRFVIVHGAYPFTKNVAALFSKANVYADFSAQTFVLYPRALAEVLRNWLEYYPEKVLFGTDATPLTAELAWEETGWLSTRTARQALALALTGMLNDGEIGRERAVELARMVLRENALKLYDWERRE